MAQKPHLLFRAAQYRVIAQIVNMLSPEIKKEVADLFATEFRKRYPKGFDAAMWTDMTGGKVQGYDIVTGKFKDEERPAKGK